MVSQLLELRHPASPRPGGWQRLFLGMALLQLAFGCTAIVDPETKQCSSDADCAALGSEFAGTTCTAKKVCERTECSSTADCNDRLGEPSYCRPDTKQCVKVLSDQCFSVYPQSALEEDDVVLVGFMAPLRDEPDSGYGTPLMEGAELALSEMETNEALLPPVESTGARTLAMLVCEHGDALETARHLVEDVGVQAIVGPAFSTPTIQVLRDVAQPNGVLLLSASATSPVITELDDDGLMWRTAPSDEWQAEALKWVLLEIERHLEDSDRVAPGRANIVLTQKGEAAGSGLVYLTTNTNTKIEGVELPPNIEPDRTLPYGDPENDWGPVHEELMLDPPDIVVALGTDEFVRNLLPLIEERWDEFPLAKGKPRPWYLLPEGDRTVALLAYAADHPELAERVIGTAPGARRYRGPDNRGAGFPGFAGRFRGRYQHDPGNLAEFAYDAVYLLAYAIANTQLANPAGADIARALRLMSCKDTGSRLLSADPIGAVRAISTAAAAGADGCLDFDGVSGPLDFDMQTGEARSDMGLWCLRQESSDFVFEPLLGAFYSTETYTLDETAWTVDLSAVDWCQRGTGGD
jgi:branched-chain amino acid transport system substrate-binding protein